MEGCLPKMFLLTYIVVNILITVELSFILRSKEVFSKTNECDLFLFINLKQ